MFTGDPWSTAILTGGSMLAGGLESQFGNKGKWEQIATMTPEQKKRADWAGQYGQQQISNPYAGFEPVAQKAQSMFRQQTIPTLAERFTSMGSNALSSPDLMKNLYGSGEDLSESLAAMMAQYGLHQQGLGQSLMGMGQQSQFENNYKAPSPSFLSGMFGGASSGMGNMAGSNMRMGQLEKIIKMLSAQR